jgi:hypothetical protein
VPVPDPGRRDLGICDGTVLAEGRRLELGDHARDLLVAAFGQHVDRLALAERWNGFGSSSPTLSAMRLRCPECGGQVIELLGNGYARCDSSRVHSPRGPQDTFDGRRCGTQFWVGLSAEDQGRIAAQEDTKNKWRHWIASTGARLEAATQPAEIACLLISMGSEMGRIQGKVPVADLPAEVYREAWRKFIASSNSQPTHDRVEMRFEKLLLRSICDELSRRPLWRCWPDAAYFIDADGVVFEEDRSQYAVAGAKAGTGTFVVEAGEPCKIFSITIRRTTGPWYVWNIVGGGRGLKPVDAERQERAFPGHILGLVRDFAESTNKASEGANLAGGERRT